MSSGTDLDELKRAHPIDGVVASYGITLRRSGRNLVGRCPFHPDGGRPNLCVYPTTSSFYCFRCAAGGDVITFIRRLEGLSFPEAVARLGGEPVRNWSLRPPATRRPGRRLRVDRDECACLAAAVDFYQNQLFRSQAALDYLAGRGIQRETIERYRLGYAAGTGLISYLRWRRLPVGAAYRRGLITRSGIDFLAGRVVVPEIRSAQPVWLIGRGIGAKPAGPKYLALPGPRPLLGWEEARTGSSVVLVEGIFDWLVLRQWDIPALALCGTHVRTAVLAALGCFETIYLALDADPAGVEATATLLQTLDLRARRLDLPGVKDVAQLAMLPNGPEVFARTLERWQRRAA